MGAIRLHLQRGIDLRQRVRDEMDERIRVAAQIATTALQSGHKILICGNGGSAADAQHIAAEMVGRYKCNRRPLPALALTTDTSILTAIANDYDFGMVFARQVAAFGCDGDVLIALSTSGSSTNVVNATDTALARGMRVIALTGDSGGGLAGRDVTLLNVPSSDTTLIQEVHITIGHIFAEFVEGMACTNGMGASDDLI